MHATSPIQFAPALLTAVALIACSSAALGQSANQNQKTAPSLKLPAAPAPSKGTLDASGTLPNAEEIFAKANAASGGVDLIRMQTARTQTGKISTTFSLRAGHRLVTHRQQVGLMLQRIRSI